MKILSTVTLLMIGASAARATGVASSLLAEKAVPTMMAQRDRIQSRILEGVSEQCETDTLALHSTTELATAYQAWEAEEFDFDTICTGNADAATVTCVLDSKTLMAHNDVTSACELVGGNVFLYSDSISCSISDVGVSGQFNVRIIDFPECIADSCNEDEVLEEAESAVENELVPFYELELSQDFASVQCSMALGLDSKVSLSLTALFAAMSWFAI